MSTKPGQVYIDFETTAVTLPNSNIGGAVLFAMNYLEAGLFGSHGGQLSYDALRAKLRMSPDFCQEYEMLLKQHHRRMFMVALWTLLQGLAIHYASARVNRGTVAIVTPRGWVRLRTDRYGRDHYDLFQFNASPFRVDPTRPVDKAGTSIVRLPQQNGLVDGPQHSPPQNVRANVTLELIGQLKNGQLADTLVLRNH